jgi:hypothetical protein
MPPMGRLPTTLALAVLVLPPSGCCNALENGLGRKPLMGCERHPSCM